MKKIFLLAMLVVLLSGCEKKVQLNRTIFAMDTTIDITIYQGNEENLDDLVNIFYDYSDLADYNNHYNGITNVYDLNRNAYDNEVVVSNDLFDLLLNGKEAYHKTKGFFNIAIGDASFLWKEIKEEYDLLKVVLNKLEKTDKYDAIFNRYHSEIKNIDKLIFQNDMNLLLTEMKKDVVDYNRIKELLDVDPLFLKMEDIITNVKNRFENISIDDVILNEDRKTVKYNNENLKIDLGGIVKGYALNQCAIYLKEKGIVKYMINAGSSSLALGQKQDGGSFKVGLIDPKNVYGTYMGIECRNSMISTSGDYQNYFEYGGKKYHHILNAKTLENDYYYHCVTILNSQGLYLDILSTALFCMDIDSAKALVEELEVDAIFYLADGTIYETQGVIKI